MIKSGGQGLESTHSCPQFGNFNWPKRIEIYTVYSGISKIKFWKLVVQDSGCRVQVWAPACPLAITPKGSQQAWDTVKLTLKVGFICPFVVIDPTYLGATTELLSLALSSSAFMLIHLQPIPIDSPTQNTNLFTNGNKASLSATVCLIQKTIRNFGCRLSCSKWQNFSGWTRDLLA